MQAHRHDLLMMLSSAMRLTQPAKAPAALVEHLQRALTIAYQQFSQQQKRGKKRHG